MQKLLFSPCLINFMNSIKLNLYLKNNKMKIIKNYCLIKLFLFILIIFFFIYTVFIKNDEKKLQLKMRIKAKISPPLILSWNKFFGTSLFEQNNIPACSHRCHYSSDRALEQNASVIIFHIRDEFGQLPKNRSAHQFYTFFLLESPIHSGENHKNVPPDFFNISMTYRADSDIFFPYDAFDPILDIKIKNGVDQWKEEESEQKIGLKSKLALQFVSNCQTNSKREKFVHELKKYMNVTEIGQCDKNRGCEGDCYDKMIDEHFFYLAFENSVCQNYVTEKFWNIKRLIVPVVLNRKVLDNLSIPPEAFIAADDFGSARELAEHLRKVAAHRQLYRRHFEWTKKYKKTKHGKWPEDGLCELCKLANEEPRKQRRIKNIVEFWENGQCQEGYAEKIAKGK